MDECGEALEYDLITLGLRLRHAGTKKLSWRDLLIIVRHLPPTSAVRKAAMSEQEREDAEWTLTNQLLALMGDGINWLVWAKTKDGEKGRNQPDPIPRPGVDDGKNQITGTPEPVEDIMRWLDPRFAGLSIN